MKSLALVTEAVLCSTILAVVVSGCSSGGSSGGSVTATVTPTADGNWLATVTHSVVTTCGEPPTDEVFTLLIEQDGDHFTLTADNGLTATATLDGNKITFTYSFPDGDGTTTSTVTLNFSSLADAAVFDIFTGTGEYSFTSSSLDCTGTDDWSGSRVPEPPPPGTGLSGAWNLTLSSIATSCGENPQETVTIPVTVTHVGDDVTVALPGIAEFSGSTSSDGTQLYLYAEYDDPLSEFAVVAEGLLEIAKDQNNINGPMFYIYTDVENSDNNCNGNVQWDMVRLPALP